MASSWTFKLYVNNTTDLDLTIKSKSLNWGNWYLNNNDKSAPIDIKAHTNQEVLGIRAAKGTWTGYECSCTWSADGNNGSLSLYIDVPFSADNHSRLTYNGLLHIDNWSNLPSRGHNFIRQIDLSMVGDKLAITNDEIMLDQADLKDDGYSMYLNQLMNNNDIVDNWAKLKEVEEISTFNPIENLPASYHYPPKILIGRSPVMTIPKNEWAGLGDPIFETLFQKKEFVDEYFAVGIYTVNTDPRAAETIVAGVDTAVETTIEVTSSIKNTLTTHYSIKTSLSAKGTVPKIATELAATLESEFSLTNVTENSKSRMERETKTIKIAVSEKNRMFVQWLYSEALAIYRKRKNGNIDLVAISEWPIQIIDKMYEY